MGKWNTLSRNTQAFCWVEPASLNGCVICTPANMLCHYNILGNNPQVLITASLFLYSFPKSYLSRFQHRQNLLLMYSAMTLPSASNYPPVFLFHLTFHLVTSLLWSSSETCFQLSSETLSISGVFPASYTCLAEAFSLMWALDLVEY